jgi:hypothetical protein
MGRDLDLALTLAPSPTTTKAARLGHEQAGRPAGSEDRVGVEGA